MLRDGHWTVSRFLLSCALVYCIHSIPILITILQLVAHIVYKFVSFCRLILTYFLSENIK